MTRNIFFLLIIVVGVLLSCKKDETEPVISLLGDAQTEVCVGDEYDDAGATASDNIDGDLTDYIQVVNDVDTSQEGIYSVTYMVTDDAGNTATLEREVTVIYCK